MCAANAVLSVWRILLSNDVEVNPGPLDEHTEKHGKNGKENGSALSAGKDGDFPSTAPLTTASADPNPVLHATIQHHRETTSDVTEEAPISPGYTAADCSGEPPTTARVDNMHPVLHAMTQHDRATTSDVREETKSRDYTEVANRRESPTTARAGSTEELPRETRRPEEAVTSDITGETYGSGDQTAANGRGRFPPMVREGRARTVTMHYGVNALHVPADRL
ncbi:hypothetical protein ACOMHN_014658 [Nucella lapillus]